MAMTPEERRLHKNEQQKIYWSSHREEIAKKRNVTIVCDVCGKQVLKRHLDRHKASGRHTKISEELFPPVVVNI
jgi:hypothetical protein